MIRLPGLAIDTSLNPSIRNEIPSEIAVPVVSVPIGDGAVWVVVATHLVILASNINASPNKKKSEIASECPFGETPRGRPEQSKAHHWNGQPKNCS
jgi:hypothetical protein